MDQTAEKLAQIERKRAETAIRYPALWSSMIMEWSLPGPEDRAWLLYSANYLFRTAGVRWALDPLTLHWRVPAAPQVDAARDLQGLSFILLTHGHTDHMDLDMVHALNALPIQWVVPEHLLEPVADAGLSRSKIIIPKLLESFQLEGISITPFDGLHWETDSAYPAGRRGVPATGYLVEFSGKRWLFPGDTRTYDISQLPLFGSVDGLFAHLWLGRGSALNEKPPLLEAFCSFYLDLNPKRIIVSHLQEFGRAADEFWDDAQFQLVRQRILERAPGMLVESACLGEKVNL